MCQSTSESINHLMLHCPITDMLWKIFISLIDIVWTMARKIIEVLLSWEKASTRLTQKDGWRFVPACIWWTI
ncbi:hypothetical protein MTR67_046788 [Solanum verrucosum]|uniref:Reverse transcriptase zinc-binding domain-containing protein n=1 Tax=Solanum verrucosum TaxID=315347 RepID=A0AAF0ZXJ7_SOLVR|nr:hypothetical protein MTR67_046788 [Solanum verrucosum]